MTAQTMNETYGFKTDITDMDDEQVFTHVESLFLDENKEPKIMSEVITLFTYLAHERNNARAQNNLGSCYANGEGVEQNYKAAVFWYQKAADQGHAIAQHNLAACYTKGTGVERDVLKGIKLLFCAAANGDDLSETALEYSPYPAIKEAFEAIQKAGRNLPMATIDEIINPLAPKILKELGAQEPA